MKESLFWRVMGAGAIVGLIAIGYGLGKNSQIPSPSFSSAAYADETAPTTSPADEAKKMPELVFKSLNSNCQIKRAKVPGGWLLIYNGGGGVIGSGGGAGGITFYPDPKHEWNGGSMDIRAEVIKEMREAAGKQPRRLEPPPFNPAGAAAKALELYDADKDGKISGAELNQAPGLKAALKVMGTDKDKGVTADHISTRVQKWLDSRIGRMSLSCQVTHNGQPLAGATVKFVPEKFLNAYSTETASGTTNQTGMAMISLPTQPGPDGDPPGLPTGMYRVEITKDGENIPAKYNTETTLGQEVSLDNIDLQMGIKFNLKY